MQAGKSYINMGGGIIAFPPHKFSTPPIIICQLVRSNHFVWNSGHLNIYPFNITTDSFQYIVRGEFKQGDQIYWLAIEI